MYINQNIYRMSHHSNVKQPEFLTLALENVNFCKIET